MGPRRARRTPRPRARRDGASAPGPDGEIALAAPGPSRHAGTAARCVLGMAVLAAAGWPRRPARTLPGDTSAELPRRAAGAHRGLAARGRALGLPVDGHHTALRVERAGTAARRPLPPPRQPHRATAHLAARPQRRHRTGTRPSSTTPSCCSAPARRRPAPRPAGPPSPWPGAPSTRSAPTTPRGRAARRPRRRAPRPLGIRTSAREARAALLAPPDGTSVSAHDAAGLDRMLLEWYASDTAHEATTELPRAGPEAGPGQGGTPSAHPPGLPRPQTTPRARAADLLHLHRNAVGARIRRITDLTGADLTDPGHPPRSSNWRAGHGCLGMRSLRRPGRPGLPWTPWNPWALEPVPPLEDHVLG
ncbi:helix-turn-helix domain-containing protein [Streptomyces sp. KL116D]|uniref:helix-turn-helix domain-containing protein n=1 Tax=Streptomyces sp. KL116D TaxID=3045152 RepID=UPI003557BC08